MVITKQKAAEYNIGLQYLLSKETGAWFEAKKNILKLEPTIKEIEIMQREALVKFHCKQEEGKFVHDGREYIFENPKDIEPYKKWGDKYFSETVELDLASIPYEMIKNCGLDERITLIFDLIKE